jgi:hypothetical protein
MHRRRGNYPLGNFTDTYCYSGYLSRTGSDRWLPIIPVGSSLVLPFPLNLNCGNF